MKKKKILIFLLGVLIVLFVLANYHGFFLTMEVKQKQDGGYLLAGLEFKGPYSKVGIHMKEVEEKLKGYDVVSDREFGIYYDNPKEVKPEDCKSYIGAILENNDISKIENLKSAGFKLDSIPVKNSLQVDFPIRNSFSYMIGPKKAYPALSKAMEKKGYKSELTMEIYDVHQRKIIFLMQYP